MLISIATVAFRGQDFSRFPREAQSRVFSSCWFRRKD